MMRSSSSNGRCLNEEQTAEDPSIPARMLLYNRIIHQQVGRIVYSKVVYPFEVVTPTPPYEEFGPDGRRIVAFDYDVIKLWEIPAETILQQRWFGLYPFVPLMQGGAMNASLERASVGVQQIADRRARSNAMLYLFLLARRQMPTDLIVIFWRSHPMYDEIVKESPFFEEILQEEAARESSFFKELVRKSPLYQEILHEGEELGELRVLREVALRLIKRHYPDLEEAARSRLEAIEDTDQLQQIIDGLDDAQDLAAARAALGLEG